MIKGDIVSCTTMQHITTLDSATKDNKQKILAFNTSLKEFLCNENFMLDTDKEIHYLSLILYISRMKIMNLVRETLTDKPLINCSITFRSQLLNLMIIFLMKNC